MTMRRITGYYPWLNWLRVLHLTHRFLWGAKKRKKYSVRNRLITAFFLIVFNFWFAHPPRKVSNLARYYNWKSNLIHFSKDRFLLIPPSLPWKSKRNPNDLCFLYWIDLGSKSKFLSISRCLFRQSILAPQWNAIPGQLTDSFQGIDLFWIPGAEAYAGHGTRCFSLAYSEKNLYQSSKMNTSNQTLMSTKNCRQFFLERNKIQ